MLEVTDVRSSPFDQIYHAVKVIGRSKHRLKVFEAIYYGKKRVKTVSEVVRITKLPRIRVLQEANILANNRIIAKTKVRGELAYEKDPFYSQHKNKIISLVKHPKQLKKFPTKVTPKIEQKLTIIRDYGKAIDTKFITVDEIDSFKEVKKIKQKPKNYLPISENNFKNGLKKILGEEGEFKDWGGETDDLFTTRIVINGKRLRAAFGLKGRGTKGILTPKKMGKRGDQIQRLFRAPGEVFIIQYWGQIDESIIEQMKLFAIAKSILEQKRIYYGVIDGTDTKRLCMAYKEFFKVPRNILTSP